MMGQFRFFRNLLFCLALVSQGCLAEVLSLDEILAENDSLISGQGVRAQLIAVQHAVLSSGIDARIKDIKVDVGDHFGVGDILVEFDCSSFLAQEKIYQAQLHVSEINLKVKRRLFELNNIGAQELALSGAELASAKAQAEVVAIKIKECVIMAPYKGRVVSRNAQPHEYVTVGKELVEILAQENLEVLLVAPSAWLSWLQVGESFSLAVEEITQTFSGSVVRLSGKVDPVSQTILVWGSLIEPSPKLLPGMSGNIRFKSAGK